MRVWSSPAKVGDASSTWEEELADTRARVWVVDVDAVAVSCPEEAAIVAVETIWYTSIGVRVGEQTAVAKRAVWREWVGEDACRAGVVDVELAESIVAVEAEACGVARDDEGLLLFTAASDGNTVCCENAARREGE